LSLLFSVPILAKYIRNQRFNKASKRRSAYTVISAGNRTADCRQGELLTGGEPAATRTAERGAAARRTADRRRTSCHESS
jgi:hypothetical protein